MKKTRYLVVSIICFLIAFIFFFLLVAENSHASEFDNIDTALFTASTITLALDMMQTLDIKNHDDIHETNIILGKNPSDSEVITYFVACSIANFGFSRYVLKNNYRKAWLIGLTSFQASVINNNYNIGLKFRF